MDIQTALDNFSYHRKRTIDLLESLSDADLLHTPNENQGPLWKQFRHLGRVHENYAEALESHRVNFSKGKSYRAGASKQALLAYLRGLGEELSKRSVGLSPDLLIDWFGDAVPVDQHFVRLAEHEVLHQGQLIVYLHSLKKDFPESWGVWGVA